MIKALSAKHIRSDFGASIVVFLVALPLAMGVSIASGYPPIAGLLTSIVGGLIVGTLSGAPLQVSGAAAGLTVIVLGGVQQFGIETMGLVLLLAGLMQVIAAGLHLGRWFQAVSPTVLHAMLAGIGILIFSSQSFVMLDMVPPGSGLSNLKALPGVLANLFTSSLQFSVFEPLILGLITIGTLYYWPKLAVGRLKLLPAPLVGIVLAAIIAWSNGFAVDYVTIPLDFFSSWQLSLPRFSEIFENPNLIVAALQLALIASAESLLCASALDQKHDGERVRYDKELGAQGLGNALCGVLCVLPLTGVIVRSAANIDAGGKTRLSTILHGIWMLLFLLLFPGLLQHVPTAALAGILVFTGVKLVNWKIVSDLARNRRAEFGIFVITVGVIVAGDLLTGVMIGLVLSAIPLLLTLSQLSITTEPLEEKVVVNLRGAATFLRLPLLAKVLEMLPPHSRVILKSHDLHHVDQACLSHLSSWRKRYVGQGGQVHIEGQLSLG